MFVITVIRNLLTTLLPLLIIPTSPIPTTHLAAIIHKPTGVSIMVDDETFELESEDEATSTTSSIIFDSDYESDCSSVTSEGSINNHACEEQQIEEGQAASAVPYRVYQELYEEAVEKQQQNQQEDSGQPQLVEDIDAIGNYNARYLTPSALAEAERRSKHVQHEARMRTYEWARQVPLKAHEHPEPQSSRLRRSVLKGLGRSSRLCASWTAQEVEVEERLEWTPAASWADDDDDVLEDISDVQAFFLKRG